MRSPQAPNESGDEAAGSISPARILIVKLTSVGDVLHALPAVSGIRRRFPEAHLAWLVDYRAADVVAMSRDVDEVIVLGEAASHGDLGTPGAGEHLRALKQVRAAGFDLVVDMQGLLKSAVFTYLSRARVRVGFGAARVGNRWATNVKLRPLQPRIHATAAYCRFAEALGAEATPDEFRIRVPEEGAQAAERLFARAGEWGDASVAAIIPGSAWPSKRWPPEHFGELAARLVEERDMRILVLGHGGDRSAAEAIAGRCAGKALSLAGETTLGEAIAVAARCRLVVGGDTGLVQIAAALRVPTVAIYGPTDPALTGPVGPRVEVVQTRVDCWPCRERECEHWECMRELGPGAVLKAAALV
ncbi:MAG: lipopolysaccharide heptosyltransferase I [Armatimonadota bacterium]|jgi:lipopolysaccharide heptosyltransferase I